MSKGKLLEDPQLLPVLYTGGTAYHIDMMNERFWNPHRPNEFIEFDSEESHQMIQKCLQLNLDNIKLTLSYLGKTGVETSKLPVSPGRISCSIFTPALVLTSKKNKS